MLQQICAVQFRICVHIRIQVFHQALASEPVGRKKTDIQNIRHISGNDLGLQAVDARVPLLFICRGIVVVLGVIRHLNAVVRIAAVKPAYHSAGKGIQVHNCKTEHFLLRCLTWGRLRQNDQVVFDPVHGLLGGGGDDSAILQHAETLVALARHVTVDPVEQLYRFSLLKAQSIDAVSRAVTDRVILITGSHSVDKVVNHNRAAQAFSFHVQQSDQFSSLIATDCDFAVGQADHILRRTAHREEICQVARLWVDQADPVILDIVSCAGKPFMHREADVSVLVHCHSVHVKRVAPVQLPNLVIMVFQSVKREFRNHRPVLAQADQRLMLFTAEVTAVFRIGLRHPFRGLAPVTIVLFQNPELSVGCGTE